MQQAAPNIGTPQCQSRQVGVVEPTGSLLELLRNQGCQATPDRLKVRLHGLDVHVADVARGEACALIELS